MDMNCKILLTLLGIIGYIAIVVSLACFINFSEHLDRMLDHRTDPILPPPSRPAPPMPGVKPPAPWPRTGDEAYLRSLNVPMPGETTEQFDRRKADAPGNWSEVGRRKTDLPETLPVGVPNRHLNGRNYHGTCVECHAKACEIHDDSCSYRGLDY